ncbi:efflux RND transporter periplasmic adaptor subunit [Hymenobacter negativus]|uniref:Efflux RND transporter periplasmic adaptor subunit n=1 Tax=Hymenobacter negativus TaxID=2795026 RepID=A0ABS3QG01_9BACT|nr:efflux RND transporter periplasmic adaptor subunit [Hymenobacter negativus]MBO2010102.1 efflux RND transporter periplasmic adaptor subunit [Hymenobacter negativus]
MTTVPLPFATPRRSAQNPAIHPKVHARKVGYRWSFLLGAALLGACTESPVDELNQPEPQAQAAVSGALPEPALEELVLSGEIATDGNRTARVFPLVGGQVVRVGAELGDEVRQGQVLAVLKSSEIADLQNQHTAGTADLVVARKNLAVAEELYQAGLAAEQDVYKARVEVARATGNDTRNQRQLGVYSIAKSGLNELRAPLAGYVIEKNLALGLRFTTANMQTAFTVANLDSVWLMANVFEADLDRVRKGQTLEITTLSYPDQPLRGRIDKVFHVLDHDSKVMKVRCTLPNPGHRLKPGMHAQVRILAETKQ